jgi:hypothetical protein
LQQERAAFLWTTGIRDVRPETKIETTVPGQYDKLLEHIDVHRWYLGEQQGREVGYAEALASWVDRVYQPLVQTIREQDILSEFPGRTETDLYLWIIAHLDYLRQIFGEEVSIEQAAGSTLRTSQRPVKDRQSFQNGVGR